MATFDTGDPGASQGGPYRYQVYNAYETKTTQSCSTSTVGCCSSTSLTRLMQDTSTQYNCWSPQALPNDFAIQVRRQALVILCLPSLQDSAAEKAALHQPSFLIHLLQQDSTMQQKGLLACHTIRNVSASLASQGIGELYQSPAALDRLAVMQTSVWQNNNAALGNHTLTMHPWTDTGVTGAVTVSGYASITSPLQPYSQSIFNPSTGKRWCQATNTDQASDQGEPPPAEL